MYKFKIETLKCMSCVHNIEDVLKEIDDHVEVSADIDHKILMVKSDQTKEQLKKIIELAGYPVSAVTE